MSDQGDGDDNETVTSNVATTISLDDIKDLLAQPGDKRNKTGNQTDKLSISNYTQNVIH